MSKKDDFKNFIKNKPELIKYIKNKEMSIQDFYEIYDIYGENNDIWKEYLDNKTNNNIRLSEVLKNIDLDDVQKHINNAQKALGVVGEFTNKSAKDISDLVKGPLTSRPINKFFED